MLKACQAAGLTYLDPKRGKERPSKLMYDGKRSAVRNMIRAGVPETVAMRVAGIETRSILARYDITSDADKRAALAAMRLPVPDAQTR